MKVVLTGGHLTPALAVLDFLIAHSTECVFIGRRYAQRDTQLEAQEYTEVTRRGISFHAIPAAHISHTSLGENLYSIWEILRSVVQSITVLLAEKPDVVLSFGSYVGVPVAVAARLLGIPLVLHEQTRTPGKASTFIDRVATQVAISFDETASYFSTPTVLTGNPLRSEILKTDAPKPSWIPREFITELESVPLIYITGGSQGSKALNHCVLNSLDSLLTQFCIVHQTGPDSNQSNWHDTIADRLSTLAPELGNRYCARAWLLAEELSWVYTHTAIVCGRSGANTVAEIEARRLPAVFVPLPHAHDSEQHHNALPLVHSGVAILLDQSDLTEDTLRLALEAQLSQKAAIQERYSHIRSPHLGAPERMYRILEDVTAQKH